MRRTKLSVTIAMLLASRVSGAAEFTVDTTADVVGDDNVVSLREAVMAASSNSVVNGDLPAGDLKGDSIDFDPSVFDGTSPIVLAVASPLTIMDDLIIDGSEGGAVVRIDASGVTSNIFAVDTSEFVRLTGMSLVNGNPGVMPDNRGGAVNLAAGCDVALTKMSISGNTAFLGGGVYSECDSLSIIGTTITGNSAAVNGGAVHSAAGTVSISNSTIESNVASQEGGGLWNSGHMTVTSSTISGNTALISNAANDAQGGGGVFNNGGTISIMNTPITNNTVIGDSAGADDGGGGVFNDGRNTTGSRIDLIGSTTLSENTVLATSLNGGGGLNIGVMGNGAELTAAQGVRIIDNSAARAGGGIESNNGILTLTGVEISGNSTGVNGGGLHVTGADVTTISLSTITDNTVGQEGGGLWNSATGHMEVSGSTISGNTALIGNASNDAQGGGGVFNNGGTISISNTMISNNTVQGDTLGGADDGGGGVFNDGRNTSGAQMNLIGTTTLSNNTVLTTSLNGGGGLNVGDFDSSPELTATQGVRVLNNVAARAGGGIESINGILTLSGIEISGNSTGVNGGGLHVTGADVTSITEAAITNNTAGQEGGGLWNSATGQMEVSGSTISGNTALIGNAANDAQGGGGVFNNGGTISIMNTPITHNTVIGDSAGVDDGGGGVFNDGRNTASAVMALSGSTTLSNNTALATSLNGGGGLNIGSMGMLGATMTLSEGVRVLNNTVARAGGGIESNNGILTLTGVEISGNSTGVNGGGIHVTSADQSEIVDSTVTDNTAGQEGGGLWNSATGQMSVSGSTISGNTALIGNAAGDAQGGGGVFNNGGTVSIHNSGISNNVVMGDSAGADDGGGGVLNDGRNTVGAVMALSGSTTLSNNTALSTSLNGGGGLNVGSFGMLSARMTLSEGVRVLNNTVARAGGGIESNNGILSITGVEISGNSTGINGGGVHITGGDHSTFREMTISNNTAGQEGGGLWNSATGFMEVYDSDILSNTALAGNSADAQGGGGMFNNGGLLLIDGSTIAGNLVSGDLDSSDGGAGVFNDGRNTNGAMVFAGDTDFFSNLVENSGPAPLAGRGGAATVISDNSNFASLSINGGLLTDNSADQGGGAINVRTLNSSGSDLTSARLTLSLITIQANATLNNGGAVLLSPFSGTSISADINSSEMVGNVAENEGGALWLGPQVDVEILRSQVDGNQAADGGGLFLDNSFTGDPGATVSIENSSIIRNSATGGNGGGIDAELGSLSVFNSTVSNNTADLSGGGLNFDPAADFDLAFSTVAENRAGTAGGGIASGGAGDINSSLFGHNQAPTGPDISGVVSTVEFSLISDTSDLTIVDASSNILNVDPRINTLADNGGPTLTHALLINSPAIDNGDALDCPELDQRGFARPDDFCDIGAFEFDGFLDLFFQDGFENF